MRTGQALVGDRQAVDRVAVLSDLGAANHNNDPVASWLTARVRRNVFVVDHGVLEVGGAWLAEATGGVSVECAQDCGTPVLVVGLEGVGVWSVEVCMCFSRVSVVVY